MTGAPPPVRKLRVGVLVNPVAGLGGRAGLKGSDDVERLAPFLARAVWDEETNAFARGVAGLTGLNGRRLVLATAPGVMGEDVVKVATRLGGPVFEVVRIPGWQKAFGQTTRDDTGAFARHLVSAQLDLLVFVGGDGTAVDVARAVGPQFPILGIPAGVKMFSPVFAQTPALAASLLNQLEPGFARSPVEVLDLDEESYRTGSWIVRSQTVACVPQIEGIQTGKGGPRPTSAEQAQDLVVWFGEHQRPGVAYVLGSGTTVGAIKAALGGGTPLGVDVWRDGRFVVEDASEESLLSALGDEGPAEVLVSPTGSQGALLGRGTAQISPAVLERVGVEGVVAVATPDKLVGLRELFVDTGDAELDRQFPEYVKIRTDAWTEKVFPLRRGVPVRARL